MAGHRVPTGRTGLVAADAVRGSPLKGLAAAALLLAAAAPALTPAAPPRQLKPGETVVAEIAGGGEHVYEIGLMAGDSLSLGLDLMGIAVDTDVKSPSGASVVVRHDSWESGTVTTYLIAAESGMHRVLLSAARRDAFSGRYALRVSVLRPATDLDRKRVAAQAAYEEGVAAEQKDPASAKTAYERAVRLWREAQDRWQEAQALHMVAFFRERQGDAEGALAIYEQVLPMRLDVHDDRGRVSTLVNIGLLLWRKGRYDESEGALSRALLLCRDSGDKSIEASTLNSLGVLYNTLADYPRAIERLEEALRIQRERHEISDEARALNNLTFGYRALGDFDRALAAAERSLVLRRQAGDRRGEVYTLNNLGWLWIRIGEPARAAQFLEDSNRLYRELAMKDETEADNLNGLALVQAASGDLTGARELSERALAIGRKLNTPRLEIRCLIEIGSTLAAQGDHAAALVRWEQALQRMKAAPDPSGQVRVLQEMCESRISIGEAPAAQAPCLEGVEKARALHLTASEAVSIVGQARLERALNRRHDASVTMEQAFSIFERLADRVASSERAVYFASGTDRFRFWIDLLLELDAEEPGRGWAERAFLASERLRSRALLDTLAASPGDRAAALAADLRERQSSTNTRISVLQRKLARPGADARAVEAELASAERDYEHLIDETRRRQPELASLRYGAAADVETARRLLDPETALVSYFAGERSFRAFVVTRDLFEVVPLDAPPSEVAARVRNTMELLERDSVWQAAARRLAQTLVEPVRARLPPTIRRLVVVPDGPLHALPFEALPSGGAARYLIEDYAISYAPSVTVLAALTARQGPAGRADLLAFANPAGTALSRRNSNGETVRSLFEREGLAGAPIPQSAREVRELGRFAGARSEIHLGSDAGEHLFKRRVGAGFRVVHLATHALLSERQPSRSALVLAADAEEEDGFLQAREISGLSIPSDLVVLSGCRTARGRILAGEGVQGLARAFFEAGTPSVVATLWEVEDRAAAQLMGAFYRQLAAGLPKSDALRAAKLEGIRSRSPSPRHWAAFVILGDGFGTVKLRGAVPAADGLRWNPLVLVAFVAAGLAAAFLVLRRRA